MLGDMMPDAWKIRRRQINNKLSSALIEAGNPSLAGRVFVVLFALIGILWVAGLVVYEVVGNLLSGTISFVLTQLIFMIVGLVLWTEVCISLLHFAYSYITKRSATK